MHYSSDCVKHYSAKRLQKNTRRSGLEFAYGDRAGWLKIVFGFLGGFLFVGFSLFDHG